MSIPRSGYLDSTRKSDMAPGPSEHSGNGSIPDQRLPGVQLLIRLRRERERKIADMANRSVDELLDMITGMEDNASKVLDSVNTQALAIWSTYALLNESKRLTWLTVGLVALTIVLAVLTARLAGLW